MPGTFTTRIGPHVQTALQAAARARHQGDPRAEFGHLEDAHVLGQASTWWHVRVHGLMLVWAVRNADWGELVGQALRVVGAATKTALGWVPRGNTGGADVSPFAVMPLSPEHAARIREARAGA